MAGLGLFSIGSTPFGAGTPVAAIAPPSDLPEFANYIDPRSSDYVVQDDGGYQRMPLVRHRVLMLLKTELGSAAYEPDVGLLLPKKMGASFEQQVRGSVIQALSLIGSDIRIDDVIVVRSPMGRADITVAYTDLTTGNSDTLTL
jgi:phage baseplate assembly protein W